MNTAKLLRRTSAAVIGAGVALSLSTPALAAGENPAPGGPQENAATAVDSPSGVGPEAAASKAKTSSTSTPANSAKHADSPTHVAAATAQPPASTHPEAGSTSAASNTGAEAASANRADNKTVPAPAASRTATDSANRTPATAPVPTRTPATTPATTPTPNLLAGITLSQNRLLQSADEVFVPQATIKFQEESLNAHEPVVIAVPQAGRDLRYGTSVSLIPQRNNWAASAHALVNFDPAAAGTAQVEVSFAFGNATCFVNGETPSAPVVLDEANPTATIDCYGLRGQEVPRPVLTVKAGTHVEAKELSIKPEYTGRNNRTEVFYLPGYYADAANWDLEKVRSMNPQKIAEVTKNMNSAHIIYPLELQTLQVLPDTNPTIGVTYCTISYRDTAFIPPVCNAKNPGAKIAGVSCSSVLKTVTPKPEQPPQPDKPTTPPIEPEKPTGPEQPTKPAQPTPPAKPSKPVKPTKPAPTHPAPRALAQTGANGVAPLSIAALFAGAGALLLARRSRRSR